MIKCIPSVWPNIELDANVTSWFLSIQEWQLSIVARRLKAKFWSDCAIPDTSMKFGTVVDHD